MSARRTRRPLGFSLRLQAFEGRITPATFTVTNNNDSGSGSLRQAVFDANANPSADLIDFSSYFNTPRTITLASTINITRPVTIDGPSAAQVTISENGAVGLFDATGAAAGTAISFVDLTLSQGASLGIGGAIAAGDEAISATRCVFTQNVGYSGGGAVGIAGDGSFTATDCTFTGNTAYSQGGGAVLSRTAASNVVLRRCEIDGNVANDSYNVDNGGGGVSVFGHFLMEDSTVSGNTAVGILNGYYGGGEFGYGGGLLVINGNVATIRNSTISDNVAPNSDGRSYGGGISIDIGSLVVQNSTITANRAGIGGGIWGSAIDSGAVSLESCIVAGNSAGAAPDILASTVNAKTSSIFSHAGITTFNDLGGNRPAGEDPRLGQLQNNGGPTRTHALLHGSPCLDVGSNPANLTTDQRGSGNPRVLNGTADMGAYEGVYPIPIAMPVSIPQAITAPGGTSYTIVVRYDDDVGINLATVDLNDIRVTGPGYAVPQAPTACSISGSGQLVTVTYTVSAPGGSFDFFDYGKYSVALIANEVADVDTPTPHFAPAGTLGTFSVVIPGTLVVDEVSDIDDGNTSTGHLSLREALRLTNAASGTSDTITFDPAVFGSPRTLTLTAGQFTVTDTVAIVGPGSGLLTLNAAGTSRHFLEGMQGTGSLLSLSGLTLTNGFANDGGGAISTFNGVLELSDVVISNCQASNAGGAILVEGSLTMRDCTISGNKETGSGGGIYVSVSGSVTGGGSVVIERSSIVNNQAAGAGGGLDIDSNDALQISDSLISGNTAATQSAGYGGGGLFITGSVGSGSFIRNSTISGNIAANGSAGGGLSLLTYDTLPISNSTITGNSTTGSGGGIAVNTGYYGGVGNVSLNSTIISGNLAGTGEDMSFPGTTNVTGNNNLIGVANAGNFTLTGADNLTGTLAAPLNSLLGPLANNGGPTKTNAILPGSPAINAGNNAVGLAFDQRGFPRVVGPTADIGAFEVQAPLAVQSVVVNDGSNQRSEVKSITVTFSEPVSFAGGTASAAAAFQVTHLTDGINVALAAAVSNDSLGRTVVMLTFAGSEIDAVSALNGGLASLADGRYSLTVFSSKVSANGGALSGGGPNGNYVSPPDTYQGNGLHLYRLFGDVNGDGVVDPTDLNFFRNTFNVNNTQSNYLWYLDANGDGVVDPTDLNQFRSRFNTNVF
jgi:hypothetical protein